MSKLNARHERFAHVVVKNGGNAAAAYREVYPKASRATAETEGPALLRRPQVARRVAQLTAPQLAKIDASAESIKLELARVAKVDIAQAFDAKGRVLPIHKMPEDVRRAISSIERDTKGNLKIRFWSKNEAAGLLAKHHGLLREILEVKDVTETRDITDEEWAKLSVLEHEVRRG